MGISAHFQRQHGFSDQFAGIDAGHRSAEQAAGFFVEQRLGHALVAAGGQCAAARGPRKDRLVVFDALRLGLGFGQTHPGDFRIGVGDGRDRARVEEGLVTGDDFGGDLGFVSGFVREHRFAADVADGVDMRHVGALLFVDRDIAALVDGDACSIGLDVTAIGPATHRHQCGVKDIRSGFSVGAFEGDLEAILLRFDFRDFGFEQDFFVALFDAFCQRAHHVFVGAGDQAVHQFNHGDFRTQRVIDGGHFEADDAAADDQHALRHRRQFQRAGGIDNARIVVRKARDFCDRGAGGNDAAVERNGLHTVSGFNANGIG